MATKKYNVSVANNLTALFPNLVISLASIWGYTEIKKVRDICKANGLKLCVTKVHAPYYYKGKRSNGTDWQPAHSKFFIEGDRQYP